MAAHNVQLGELDFLSEAADMGLQLTSSAQFAPSEEEADSDLKRLFGAATTMEILDKPWIRPSPSFKIVLRFGFPDCIEQDEQHHLADALSNTCYNASLWQQLSLKPKARDSSDDTAYEQHISTLCLEHLDTAECNVRNRPHKLGGDVYTYCISPPSGVRVLELRSIEMHFQFSLHMRSRCRNFDIVDTFAATHASPDDEEMLAFPDELHAVDQESGCKAIAPLICSPPSPDATCRRVRSSPSAHLGEFNAAERSSPPSLKRSTTEVDRNGLNTVAIRHAASDLFDAGFRGAICPEPRRLPKRIRLASHESITYMTNIAPLLFSPGYAADISTRNVMLPAISHALSHVCGLHARSVSLKGKLAELSRRHTTQQHGGVPDDQISLTACLWRLMQGQLHDKHKADGLASLQPSTSLRPECGHADQSDLFVEAEDPDFDDTEICELWDEDEGLDAVNAMDTRVAKFTTPEEFWLPGMLDIIEDTAFMESTCNPDERPMPRGAHVVLMEEDLLSICGSDGGIVAEAMEHPQAGLQQSHVECTFPTSTARNMADGIGWDMDEMLDI